MREKSPPGDTDVGDVVWKENDEASGVADLLGFDFAHLETEDRSGLRALINSAFVAHRRLPMLEVVFDRTARLMTTSLRQLADENVEVSLDDVTSTRFADFQQSLTPPAVIAIAKSEALDGRVLFAADGGLIFAMVDALLGGRRGGSVDRSDRSFTAIELSIAERIFTALLENLSEAFAPVVEGGFRLERLETTPRFAEIAQGASVCALSKFGIKFEGRGGRALALIPHAALEPIRAALGRTFISEAEEAERAWKAGFEREVSTAPIDVDAVIAERDVTVSELRALKVGDTLVFKRASGASAELRAGAAVIGCGRIGKSGDFAAIRLEAARPPPEKKSA
jgi:flagellar motor switch protein FliM